MTHLKDPAPKLYVAVGLVCLARHKTLLTIFSQFLTFPCFCVTTSTCDVFLFSQLPEL